METLNVQSITFTEGDDFTLDDGTLA